MKILRPSSLEEYASWYLRRESSKGDKRPIPDEVEKQILVMRERHAGKMRDWFNTYTRWQIVSLELSSEFSALVFPEVDWSKKEGLVIPGSGKNYRLLRQAARNASEVNYLSRPSARSHKAYYDKFTNGSLDLTDENRVAICSAERCERESNPDAKFYLLDGAGRSLPYMMQLAEGKNYQPVEAFLAERD